MRTRLMIGAATAAVLAATTACGTGTGTGGGGGASASSNSAHGPITIWYSNNAQEVAWGKQVVAAWNSGPPDREGLRPGDPGRQVVRGGHRRRDHRRHRALPDLQHVAGVGADLPAAGRPGPAQRLPRRRPATSRRAPARSADQYKSPDGKYYQLPWKSNPVMIFYNKKVFAKAGISTTNPPLGSYSQFLATAKKIVVVAARRSTRSTRRRRASSSSRGSTSTRCTRPQSGGKQLVENGKATFDSAAGQAGRRLLAADLRAATSPARRPTTVTRSPTAPRRWPSSGRGPSPSTRARSTGASCRCRPSRAARATRSRPSATPRTSRMYASCKNRGTAWDFLKFSTSTGEDGKLLTLTGQMPLRQNLQQALRGLLRGEPGVQDVRGRGGARGRGAQRGELDRDLAGPSAMRGRSRLIFGKQDPDPGARIGAATKINQLVAQCSRRAMTSVAPQRHRRSAPASEPARRDGCCSAANRSA